MKDIFFIALLGEILVLHRGLKSIPEAYTKDA
jgi:hypothetical protein